MTTRSRNPHVSPVGSELERILLNPRAATADDTPINEADFPAELARISRVDDLWRYNFYAIPEEGVDENVEDESQLEGIDEDDMPEHASRSEIGYTGPTHDDVRQMIREALTEHEEERVGCLIDDRCEKVTLALFQQAHERAMDNVHTPIYEVMEQAAEKAFFSGGADELLDEKMYRLAESQYFTQGLARHLIKSYAFTVPVTRCVKLQAERAVALEAKFSQDLSREVHVKKEEKVTPRSPLTGRSPESPRTSKDDKQEKKKEKPSSHHHSKSSSCSKCDSSRHSDN